jgi:glyoxylate reductase
MGGKKVNLDTLLKESDVVAIHSPLTKETKHLVGEKQLALMKDSAILVNAARGEVVDEKALYKALKEGWIAGAGLDVFETEPPVFRDHILLDNVVSTPHSAGLSNQATHAMAMETVKKVITLLEGKVPDNVLNPEVLKKLELSA